MNRALLGVCPAEHRAEVTAELAAACALATDDDAYEAGRSEAPPMLAYLLAHPAIVATMRAFMPEGFPPGVLHAEHDLRIHRPLRVGTSVRVRAIPAGVTVARKGGLVSVRVESIGPDGDIWTEQLWTAYLPGWTPPWCGGLVSQLPAPPSVAHSPKTVSVMVAADLSRRYDRLDHHNPIHTDDAFARSVGLPGMVLQGTCALALAGRAVLAATDPSHAGHLRRIGARFARPVTPGQRLHARIWRHDEERVTFDVRGVDGEAMLVRGVAELASR